MLRIATGSDATDTAFLSSYRGGLTLNEIEVTATVDFLPGEDNTHLTQLG